MSEDWANHLGRLLESVDGVSAGVSKFNRGHAAWFHIGTGGLEEIVHAHTKDRIDVRAPRPLQAAWKSDPRVVPRKSASPWIEIRIENASDLRDLHELILEVIESRRETPDTVQ